MSYFIGNLAEIARANTNYREVIHTGPHSQLLVMCLPPGAQTGEEAHTVDQFFYVARGTGRVELDGRWHELSPHTGVVVPAGTEHNVHNTSERDSLKLIVLSAPPHHADGAIHHTQHDARQAAIRGPRRL